MTTILVNHNTHLAPISQNRQLLPSCVSCVDASIWRMELGRCCEKKPTNRRRANGDRVATKEAALVKVVVARKRRIRPVYQEERDDTGGITIPTLGWAMRFCCYYFI